MKRNYKFKKALLITLSVLGLAVSFGQSTLHASAIENNSFETLDPDTHPDDFSY